MFFPRKPDLWNCKSRVAGGGITVGRFGLEDAAVLTQRFARHVPQPPQSFFREAALPWQPWLGAFFWDWRNMLNWVSIAKKDDKEFIKESLEVYTSELWLAMDVTANRCHSKGRSQHH